MNERIKELQELATDECGLNPNQFAELIVKECSGIAYEYDAPKMSGPGMIIAGRIETHFGVEE